MQKPELQASINQSILHFRSEFDVLHKSLQRVCQPLSTSSPTCMSSPSLPSSFMSGLSYMSAGMKSLTSPTLEPSMYKQPVPTTDTAQCQQVYVSCNYCNKSIAFSSGRTRQLILGTIAHRPKVSSWGNFMIWGWVGRDRPTHPQIIKLPVIIFLLEIFNFDISDVIAGRT